MARAQKIKFVKGPAAQRMISSRYEQSAALVVILAPRRSSDRDSRCILVAFAVRMWPSSCSAAVERASKVYILRSEMTRHKIKRGSKSPERIFIFILFHMQADFGLCKKSQKILANAIDNHVTA